MGHSVSSPLPGANLALAFVTPITDANPNRPLELHRLLIATLLAGRDRYPFAQSSPISTAARIFPHQVAERASPPATQVERRNTV
jgi:hypothetical protein